MPYAVPSKDLTIKAFAENQFFMGNHASQNKLDVVINLIHIVNEEFNEFKKRCKILQKKVY